MLRLARSELLQPIVYGLNHKWQAIDDGGYNQSFKCKNKPNVKILIKKIAESILWTKCKQQIESEHGWGKDQWKANQGFYQIFNFVLTVGEPMGKWNADKKKNHGCYRGKFHRQHEWLKVNHLAEKCVGSNQIADMYDRLYHKVARIFLNVILGL